MPRTSALVALAIAVIAVIVVIAGNGSAYTIHADFSDAGQLVPGDLVTVGGHQVGSVGPIRLSGDGLADVELDISELDRDPAAPGDDRDDRAAEPHGGGEPVRVAQPRPGRGDPERRHAAGHADARDRRPRHAAGRAHAARPDLAPAGPEGRGVLRGAAHRLAAERLGRLPESGLQSVGASSGTKSLRRTRRSAGSCRAAPTSPTRWRRRARTLAARSARRRRCSASSRASDPRSRTRSCARRRC